MRHSLLITTVVSSLIAAACTTQSGPVDGSSSAASSQNHLSSAVQSSSSRSLSATPTLKEYRNEKMGFSMKIPSHVFSFEGSCEKVDEGVLRQYDFVPLAVFETEEKVYFTDSYYYQFDGDPGNGKAFPMAECKKITKTLATVQEQENIFRKPFYTWILVKKTIENDQQLDAFIKQRFGKDCSAGERKATDQEGVFDLKIDGIFPPDEGKDCFVNYATVIKYRPSANALITWDLGQEATFFLSEEGYGSQDQEMLESFRFLE